MVRVEDLEVSSFALGEDGMIAVPADFFLDGEFTDALVYDICEETVRAHYSDVLSGNTNGLVAALVDIMRPYGYTPSEHIGEKIFTFEATSRLCGNSVETVMFHTNAELQKYAADTSLWNLELDEFDPLDAVCAVVRDGVIVASASVNDLGCDGDPEINVECAPSCRRHGYGTAVAVGLTNYLLDKCGAERVVYKFRERNIASRALALKAGFSSAGSELPFVFYRNT